MKLYTCMKKEKNANNKGGSETTTDFTFKVNKINVRLKLQ